MKRALFTTMAATLVFACGTDDDGPKDNCDTDESRLYVWRTFDFGRQDPMDTTLAPGFDLDGRVSDTGDAESCNIRDFTSPPPHSEDGIDNQLGPLFALAPNDPAPAIATSIAEGKFLVLVEVEHIDDMQNDSCVAVNLLYGRLPAGVMAPVLDNMVLAAGQTLDIDATSLELSLPKYTALGSITGGRVTAGDMPIFDLDLPLGDFAGNMDVVMPASMTGVRVRFDMTEDALTDGVMGGALGTEDAISAGVALGFADATVRPVLTSQADLEVTPMGCAKISSGWVFDAVSAVAGQTL